MHSDAIGLGVAPPPPKQVEIWPDNARAFNLFTHCLTQWRVGGMGGIIGLDYNALALVARTLRIRLTDALLQQIQVMEHELIKQGQKDV